MTTPENHTREEQLQTLVEKISAYVEQFHGGSVEFVSFDGVEGLDGQINTWAQANPGITITDVKYQVTLVPYENQSKLTEFALVLYQGQPKTKKKSSASSMARSLRTDLKLDQAN